jgi:hypothetical protein
MPANDPAYQKAYHAKHYAANKQRYVDQARTVFLQLREDVRRLQEVPCADCGMSYPYYVMDFDHRPGEVKTGHISDLMRSKGRKAVMAEIAKCDVVCANCHRIRTHGGSRSKHQ